MSFIDNFDQSSLDARWAGSAATLDDANNLVDLSTGDLTGALGLISASEWDDFAIEFTVDMSTLNTYFNVYLLTNQLGGGVNRVNLYFYTNGTGTDCTMRIRFDMGAGAYPDTYLSAGDLDFTGGPETIKFTRIAGVWTMYRAGVELGTYTENSTDGTEFPWQFGDVVFTSTGDTKLHSISIQPSTVNAAPVADDETYSIQDDVSNGTVVGTFTATDSDGTITGYSITGTTLAIDNAGQITIADNTGITAGVDITATVTATDDDGATDTALITVNVTAVNGGFPAIQLLSRLIDLNLWTAGSNGIVRGNDKTGVL